MRICQPFLLCLLLAACQPTEQAFEIDEAYVKNFEEKIEGNLANNRPFYLQLVGLYKLDPLSSNRFGASPEVAYPLSIDGIPDVIGAIELRGDSVFFFSEEQIEVKTEQDSVLTNPKLKLDEYGNSVDLYHGRLSWRVATYGKDRYLRIRDLESSALKSFKGYQRFDLSPEFIFNAKYTRFEEPKLVKVPSSMNFDREAKFVGTIEFQYQGEEVELDVQEGGFIMFSDDTSADLTYGSGRYVKFEEPDDDGNVILDFNLAYNPPCIFSEYTTCLFPPAKNRLSFKILAGELTEEL